MPRRLLVASALFCLALGLLALVPGCATKPAKRVMPPVAPPPAPVAPAPEAEPEAPLPPVMLGIDVLEAEGFAAIAGKKIGLLTHPAGVNRRGERTIDVLHRARNARLMALFAPEHGLDGLAKAGDNFADTTDPRTGLPVYSLHGKHRKPTKEMLQGLDALVIDLQDIGSRSYTFISCLRWTMEACFEHGVEVIVLDRPNPLGGLKVDGPPLDPEWVSYVGAFRVPYVHGLTMGELAQMAKEAPGVLAVNEKVRARGKLTVIPMRGWTRRMRWPDTGLRWVPTSPYVPDYNAAVGYAMVGLGTEIGGWTWGVGTFYPFRGLGYPKRTADQIIAELGQYHIPGIRLEKTQGVGRDGKVIGGVYVEITDWEALRPTELSFYMMKTAAKWSTANPFSFAPPDRQNMFNKLVGSTAWWKALTTQGGRVDVATFIRNWSERAAIYQQQSRRYWLYQ
ncbi:MAG: DUF1343 domain-containing protein [Opitutales bacterium]